MRTFLDSIKAELNCFEEIPKMIDYFEKKEFAGRVSRLASDLERARRSLENAVEIKLSDDLFRFEKTLIQDIGTLGLDKCPTPGLWETVKTFTTAATRLCEGVNAVKGSLTARTTNAVKPDRIKAGATRMVNARIKEIEAGITKLKAEIKTLADGSALEATRLREENKQSWADEINRQLHEQMHDRLGTFDCGLKGCRYRTAQPNNSKDTGE